MNRDRITELVQILKTSLAAEISVREGDSLIHIRRRAEGLAISVEATGAATVGALPAEPGQTTAGDDVELVPVQAKRVGTFHLTRPQDSAPLVEPGVQVAEGQVVGALEALGKQPAVVSPVAGEVVEIVAQSEQPVQYGDVMMRSKVQEADQ